MEPENTVNTTTNTNLTLEIQGLALCHFVEGVWKIFFPRVRGHEFKLIVSKKIGFEEEDQNQSVFILPPATKINFSIDNTTGGGTLDTSEWAEAIDLSNLHEEPIHLVSNRRKYAGFLTLHGASLVSKIARDPEKFQIWDARETEKYLVDLKTPANIFSSDFQFDGGASANIRVENDFGFDLSFPHEDDVSYKVVIFNDCEGEDCGSILDFKYLYNIIDESMFSIKRRFELIALKEFKKGISGSRCGGSASSLIANPDVF